MHDSRHARERRFRYGAPPPRPSFQHSEPGRSMLAQSESGMHIFHHVGASAISVGSDVGSGGMGAAAAAAFTPGGYAHVPLTSPPPPQPPIVVVDGGSAGGDGGGERVGTAMPSSTHAFLSTSPMLFKKAHRGDADSLRTDFLQV